MDYNGSQAAQTNITDIYAQYPIIGSDAYFQPDDIFELDQPLKSSNSHHQQHTSSTLLDLGSGTIKEEQPLHNLSYPSYSTYTSNYNTDNNQSLSEIINLESPNYSKSSRYTISSNNNNNSCDNLTKTPMLTNNSYKRLSTKSVYENNVQQLNHPITMQSDEYQYTNDFYKFEYTNYKSHRRKNTFNNSNYECNINTNAGIIQSNEYFCQEGNSNNNNNNYSQCDIGLSYDREHLMNDYNMLPVVPSMSNINNIHSNINHNQQYLC